MYPISKPIEKNTQKIPIHDDRSMLRPVSNDGHDGRRSSITQPFAFEDYVPLNHDFRHVVRGVESKLCAIIFFFVIFTLCNLSATGFVAFYVYNYEESVRVYVTNMTSSEMPSAPLSSVRLADMSSRAQDMMHAAHLTVSVMTNATDLRGHGMAPIRDAVNESAQVQQLETRLDKLYDALESAKRSADVMTGPQTVDLMLAFNAFMREKMMQINMSHVNHLIATFSDETYINSTLDLARTGMDKLTLYEYAGESVVDAVAQIAAKWHSEMNEYKSEEQHPKRHVPA